MAAQSIKDLREYYNDLKNYYKQIKFGRKNEKCVVCKKNKKTSFDVYTYCKGDSSCGCKGIGCNACRSEDVDDFAIVCSDKCETMLIMMLTG